MFLTTVVDRVLVKNMALIPTYILRLTLQHRALYCYLILSVWIIILLGGMYKYIGTEDESINILKYSVTDGAAHSLSRSTRYFDTKIKKIHETCNAPENIFLGSEGLLNDNFSLEGIIILIRHGDRGPLSHIRNISSVNCLGVYDPSYTAYENYISNITGTPVLSSLLGSFHGFPPLPGEECSLGQLTRVGASQLLAAGKLLRRVYFDPLGIRNSTTLKKDIIVYSTRYRRTLQSALAFLYTFLSQEDFHKVVLQEVQSLSFCFDDCACPSADHYLKQFSMETHKQLRTRPDILDLVESASEIIYEMPDRKISSDPLALRDALLSYICHGAKLPCLDTYTHKTCIQSDHVVQLFTYLEVEAKRYSKSNFLKRSCLLRSYGLVRNIVSHLLHLISEKRPKIVVYSGHDKTLSYLTAALGVITEDTTAPPYASRMIFEIYKNHEQSNSPESRPVGSDYFFRLLFNGKDITSLIHFCKKGIFPSVHHTVIKTKNNTNVFLCRIESIIRFLHDDYFTSFNATNMKDACSTVS